MTTTREYLQMAIELAYDNVIERHGRPFGAVLVKDGAVLSTGVNDIVATNDPSMHAEMQAIRAAAAKLNSPRLDGCAMYASGHPCPMCLSAMHMIGISQVYYAYSNDDAEPYGLSTARIYAEMAKPLSEQSIKIEYLPVRGDGENPYAAWQRAGKA